VILEKRNIFISQMQIDTKREALHSLDTIERPQEQYLLAKEAELGLFRHQFRHFLEDDGRNTMAVRSAAEGKCCRNVRFLVTSRRLPHSWLLTNVWNNVK
jgi:hypothetical protein